MALTCAASAGKADEEDIRAMSLLDKGQELVKCDWKGSALVMCKYGPGYPETLVILEKAFDLSGPRFPSLLKRKPAALGMAPQRREEDRAEH